MAVDGADGVFGEQGVGPPGQGQVGAEVPAGLGGGQGRGRVVVPELDPLVQAAMSPTRSRRRRVGWPMSMMVAARRAKVTEGHPHNAAVRAT
jgi:hypothetical protein